jgi:hypothetical protein
LAGIIHSEINWTMYNHHDVYIDMSGCALGAAT